MIKIYFTRKETASILQVSLPTLWKLTKLGRIKATRLLRRVLYHIDDLQNLNSK